MSDGTTGSTADAGPSRRGSHRRKRKRSLARELPVLIVTAIVIAVVAKSFVVQAFWIPSESMEPTLVYGDRILVNKFAYDFTDPERGDVVVFEDPKNDGEKRGVVGGTVAWLGEGLGLPWGDTDYVKRVIGVPGDRIEAEDGRVFVNGDPIDEPYLKSETEDFGPVNVPPDTLWLMGDNRMNSSDSRSLFGPVPIDDVVGEAVVRVWPPSRMGGI